MTINLTVVLESKEEFTEKVKELLEGLVANSRGEAGCIQYDLHQNIENPTIFIFHEVWENKAIFDLHNSKEYVKDFFEMVPNLLQVEPQVTFTTKIASIKKGVQIVLNSFFIIGFSSPTNRLL